MNAFLFLIRTTHSLGTPALSTREDGRYMFQRIAIGIAETTRARIREIAIARQIVSWRLLSARDTPLNPRGTIQTMLHVE